jgi:RNA polymerase sigma factor (sigma-70 family)
MRNLNFDTNEYEQELLETYHKTGDKKILSLLVERYENLVNSIARKAYNSVSGMGHDDFVQIGFIGLLKSIDRYNPRNNTAFISFAYRIIYGVMIDGMRDFSSTPRLVIARSKKLREAKDYLREKENRQVSNIEVAMFLGLSRKKYHDSFFSKMVSLEGTAFYLENKRFALKDAIQARSDMEPDKEAEKALLPKL